MTASAFDVSKIPVWNREKPEQSFDIRPEQPSGRIPVTRIEHWREFSSLLESTFFNRVDEQFIFRGHRRFDASFPRSCVGMQTGRKNQPEGPN